ncbi:hypothetical protein HU200_048352 [Digitaria exilis]|uniref:Uncharacterized protein n=1 Tax=Digitaria exilis TaxID=1010633 RepID=A0A835EC43_9POAL|nr:hypothetical protein HU200_048352 [Digitaria exilis]
MAFAVPVANNARRLQDIRVANGGPIGPGLSDLVAVAESILRKYGVTKTYADVLDLDGGLVKIAGDMLSMQRDGVQKGQPQNLENPLERVVGQLETVAKRLQSIGSSPLDELPVSVLCQIMEVTSPL